MMMLERLARSQGKRRGRPPLFLSQTGTPPASAGRSARKPARRWRRRSASAGLRFARKKLPDSVLVNNDPPRILVLSRVFCAFPGFVSGDPSQVVILKAIAGVRLPATLAITTTSPDEMREGLWELRTYRGAAPVLASHFASVFPRAGIRPLSTEKRTAANLTYLIPFENLTARDRAWTALNADPEWTRARARFQSYHFGLYRGRIACSRQRPSGRRAFSGGGCARFAPSRSPASP